jgi:hypothetical protein
MSFRYASQKFDQARSNLMLPHSQGEAQAIAHAFRECSAGLEDIDRSKLDDNAAAMVRKLEDLMSTDGLRDPTREGLHVVKARLLNQDDKIQLSGLVDNLAHWFDHQAQSE